MEEEAFDCSALTAAPTPTPAPTAAAVPLAEFPYPPFAGELPVAGGLLAVFPYPPDEEGDVLLVLPDLVAVFP